MTMADLEKVLSDLHAVLSQDVAIAAPVLAKLTGPISMTQGEHQGRKGTPWIAKFKLDLAAGLAAMGCAADSPYQQTWEYLHAHSVQVGDQLELVIEEIPDYELLAPQVKELHDQKPDLSKIRKALGVTWLTAKAALRFAETGERPARRGQKAEVPRDKAKPIYQELAPIVAKMHDEDKLKFKEITALLNQQGIQVTEGPVGRAYQYFHRDKTAATIANGEEIKRRKCPHLSTEAKCEIKQLLLAGDLSVIEIANKFGCRRTTIYRLKDQLDSSQERKSARPQRTIPRINAAQPDSSIPVTTNIGPTRGVPAWGRSFLLAFEAGNLQRSPISRLSNQGLLGVPEQPWLDNATHSN
jgi:transposase